MFLKIFYGFTLLTLTLSTIGSSICLFAYHNTNPECYFTFAISISFVILVVCMNMLYCLLNYLSPDETFMNPLSSSQQTLPLSSLPNNPSKIRVIRKKP